MDEQNSVDKFINDITIRAGNSLIRYYLKETCPDKLGDEIWCECLIDVFYYRSAEAKESNALLGKS